MKDYNALKGDVSMLDYQELELPIQILQSQEMMKRL